MYNYMLTRATLSSRHTFFFFVCTNNISFKNSSSQISQTVNGSVVSFANGVSLHFS